MKELLRSTNAYAAVLADAEKGNAAQTVLVVFPDEANLRALLTECAKAFFCARDGSRVASLIGEEAYADCLFFPEAGGKLTAEAGSRILDESALRPVEGGKKLFVLDAFHTVTPLVQNKLLKVLEEPPEGVGFLLGAANAYSVLPTVRSRAKTVTVPPFSEEAVLAALARNHAGEAGIAEAAAACGGVYSVAESLLAGGGSDFSLAERFLAGGETETICRAIGERKEKRAFFAALRLVLRDMLLYAAGQERYAARTGGGIERLAREYPAGAISAAIGLVAQAERDVQFNTNAGQAALALAIGIGKEREKWQKLS